MGSAELSASLAGRGAGGAHASAAHGRAGGTKMAARQAQAGSGVVPRTSTVSAPGYRNSAWGVVWEAPRRPVWLGRPRLRRSGPALLSRRPPWSSGQLVELDLQPGGVVTDVPDQVHERVLHRVLVLAP